MDEEERLEVGMEVKIHLKGESPWGKVLETKNDEIKVRIINKLYHELSEHERSRFMKQEIGVLGELENLHGKKQGDQLWCHRGENGEWTNIKNEDTPLEEMDIEAFMNIRNWLKNALTTQGAEITDAGMGMGRADLGFKLEGAQFSVSIRPR